MTTENKLWQFINELLKMIIGFGKAQLIMFGINFLIITVGMGIIGLGWWSLLIGIGIACLDLLPVIGAGIVFLPWTILALISGNTAMALGVAIIYIAMVIIRMVLDPVITGHHIGLSPWITLASS
ncbi:MAG: AI-2E family transporter, partial [Clostridiales bacterium]